MIRVQTPLRIPLGGGGTDLESYYSRFGGSFLTAAIKKYVTIEVSQPSSRGATLVQNPMIQESLRYFGIKENLMVSTHSDLKAGTGLGGSGAYLVSLVHAFGLYKEKNLSVKNMAGIATSIETHRLKEPVGKQDPYACALGGIRRFEVNQQGAVRSKSLPLSPLVVKRLEEGLVLYFTGLTRSASSVLKTQDTRSRLGDREMFKNLHRIREIGIRIESSLMNGQLHDFAQLMSEHWRIKRARSKEISTPEIDRLYTLAMRNGALGGKLVGAGGGGFPLFFTQDPERLNQAMLKEGILPVSVSISQEGSKAWILK